ncbi:MAG: cytidine deaminase [Candidatus Eremiobacteraeota bacterium]|nr:cytidine deaminase [Candidatus Eremiobacteraeota bacterium]
MRADSVSPCFLSPAHVRTRAAERALSVEELVLELLPWAEAYASSPISNFRVGAIALGLSGALYAGANLEFPGESLSFSVHAEQAAVYNAWVHGEAGVTLIASTAAPCGYCRQFLNELTTASELRVVLPGRPPTTLAALLPEAFGPRDLIMSGGLMQPSTRSLKLGKAAEDRAATAASSAAADLVTAAALAAASAAYAPYSGTYAGVGLRMASGAVFAGRYAENAAFNPSLSPLQGALVALTLAGGSHAAIDDAVLVEASEPTPGRLQPNAGQRATTAALLAAVAPGVPLRYLRADYEGDGRHGAGV